MSCPLCAKRKPERFCPAKGEKICAVCCGTEREVSIDCPTSCSHLVAAHRYEDEHRKPLPDGEWPSPDVEISPDFLREREQVIVGLVQTIVRCAAERASLVDADLLAALTALAETYRTLGSGIYYEKPPAAALPRELYAALAQTIKDLKQDEAEQGGFTSLKDAEVFHLLVFLLRLGRNTTNGRPRTRGFLQFLRTRFTGGAELAPAESRIILP